MRQKEAKITASASMDSTNLSEPLGSRRRQIKQNFFIKRRQEIYKALGKKILKQVGSFWVREEKRTSNLNKKKITEAEMVTCQVFLGHKDTGFLETGILFIWVACFLPDE